jgi:C4-dicarboxylate-specific signal transduction histidine kinase
VPLLKDNELIGVLGMTREQVQPFTDRQIDLVAVFAAQTTIALESTRRERQYREAQMALAHANRIATMGQLSASITHEVNQPITAAVTYALAAQRWLSGEPPDFGEVSDALAGIIKEGNRASDIIERIRALIKKSASSEGCGLYQRRDSRSRGADPHRSSEQWRVWYGRSSQKACRLSR